MFSEPSVNTQAGPLQTRRPLCRRRVPAWVDPRQLDGEGLRYLPGPPNHCDADYGPEESRIKREI